MSDRIRTDDGYLTVLGEQLGRERMEKFMTGQANVQAMSLFLVMAVATVPNAGYSDDALDVLISDAEDVRKAAAGLTIASLLPRQRKAGASA